MLRTINKKTTSFKASSEIQKIVNCRPYSAIIYIISKGTKQKLCRVTFILKNGKIFTNDSKLYLKPKIQLKYNENINLKGLNISLRFISNTYCYSIKCKITEKIFLLPETKVCNALQPYALVLRPFGRLTKTDRRNSIRYFQKTKKKNQKAFIPQVNFDLYLNMTNTEFPIVEKHSPDLTKLKLTEHNIKIPEKFHPSKAYKSIRDIFLQKKHADRFLFARKISRSTSNEKKTPTIISQIEVGRMHLLGIQTAMFHENLILGHPSKSLIYRSVYGNKRNPYRILPGDIILIDYDHGGKYYQLSSQVIEASKQKHILRPLELPTELPGIKLKLINYSMGGAFVEGNIELVKILFSKSTIQNFDFHSGNIFKLKNKEIKETIGQPIIHLTFYPRLKFPKSIRRFKPELPFKFCILGKIVGARLLSIDSEPRVQLNIQFAYEKNYDTDWTYLRNFKRSNRFTAVSKQIEALIRHMTDYK